MTQHIPIKLWPWHWESTTYGDHGLSSWTSPWRGNAKMRHPREILTALIRGEGMASFNGSVNNKNAFNWWIMGSFCFMHGTSKSSCTWASRFSLPPMQGKVFSNEDRWNPIQLARKWKIAHSPFTELFFLLPHKTFNQLHWLCQPSQYFNKLLIWAPKSPRPRSNFQDLCTSETKNHRIYPTFWMFPDPKILATLCWKAFASEVWNCPLLPHFLGTQFPIFFGTLVKEPMKVEEKSQSTRWEEKKRIF